MSSSTKHTWTFTARFRKNAFGWRSSRLAVQRVKEAVSEIKKCARNDHVLGAEGAVKFLEKVSPALEHVDSSSGAIGTAVNNAIDALVPIIAGAPADGKLRDRWLDRLWQAVEEDNIPYIELLPDRWGELCVTPEVASHWADNLIDIVRLAWRPDKKLHGCFEAISACMSALYRAGRNDEILELLALAPSRFWHYQKWGVKALEFKGRKADAIHYAEECRNDYSSSISISQACEEILLSSGMAEEAYSRYAADANKKSTYLATFRAIVRKYPHKEPADILRDLVASTPGDEGKWFAAARSAGLYDEAIKLANHTPCDPRTLTRAARDMVETEPLFAVEAGMAAIRWLVEGYGYEISGQDVWAAYDNTMKAAENAGCRPETLERIRKLVAGETFSERFVNRILGGELDLDT